MDVKRAVENVTAIVLAAGESRRMGHLKQLLPFGDSTILERTVDNILQSGVGEIIVVLGHRADEIAPRLAGKTVKIVINPDYRQGMSSSLRCGLSQVSEEASTFMIVLGDQPLVGPQTVARLLEGYAGSSHGVVAPVYQGRRGHPVIFSAKYRSELLSLEGDTGARSVIEAHPEDVGYVEVDSPGVVTGIDTEADYRNLTG